MLKYKYREHGGEVRVWREDWSGDQFEVFTDAEFNGVKTLFAHLSIPLVEDDSE